MLKPVAWDSPKEYWTAFRKEMARALKPGGKCITLAWNNQGTGKGLGFEITRILLVAHVWNRNDTIVIVDRIKKAERGGEEGEQSSDTTQDNYTSEKKATQMSGISGQNPILNILYTSTKESD